MTGGSDWILAIESAVLHGIWQVAAIGAMAAIVFASRPALRPATRADIASAALMASAATFVFTCCWSLAHTGSATLSLEPVDLSSVSAMIPGGTSNRGTSGLDGGVTGYAIAFASTWIAGLVALTSWTLVQSLRARRLRTQTSDTPLDWQARFEVLARRAGVRSRVRLLASRIVDVPMVVGCLRPVILMPAAAFTAMPRAQLEVVLLHELAHIRRHDPVFDLLQRVAVNLLFFHPVAWWLRRIVVVQRELACDDDATVDGETARSLAQALLRIQSLRHAGAQARLLTPLSSQGDPLMIRITRLLTDSSRLQRPGGSTRARLAAGTAALAIGLSMSLAWARPMDPPLSKSAASVQVEMLATMSEALKRSVTAGTISEKDAMAMYKMFAEGFAADLHKHEKTDDVAATKERMEALTRKVVEGHKIVAGEISPEDVKWYFEGLKIALKQSVSTGAISEKDAMAIYKMLASAVADDVPKDREVLDAAANKQRMGASSRKVVAGHGIVEGHKIVAGEISPEDVKWYFEGLKIALKQSVSTGAISEKDAMAMYTLFLAAVADDMSKDQGADEAIAIR